jgi:hypothetical protein
MNKSTFKCDEVNSISGNKGGVLSLDVGMNGNVMAYGT